MHNLHEQNLRSDVVLPVTLSDTNLNCFSTTNNSLVVSGDVSDSGSLSGGSKMVTTRRRRVVRTISDFIISNESGGTSGNPPVKKLPLKNCLGRGEWFLENKRMVI